MGQNHQGGTRHLCHTNHFDHHMITAREKHKQVYSKHLKYVEGSYMKRGQNTLRSDTVKRPSGPQATGTHRCQPKLGLSTCDHPTSVQMCLLVDAINLNAEIGTGLMKLVVSKEAKDIDNDSTPKQNGKSNSNQIHGSGRLTSTTSESDLFDSSSDHDIHASPVGMTSAVMYLIETDMQKSEVAQHGTHKVEQAKLTSEYHSKSEQSSQRSNTRSERNNVAGVDDTNEPFGFELTKEGLESMAKGGEHASVTNYDIIAQEAPADSMSNDPERASTSDSTVSSHHIDTGIFEQESPMDFHNESIGSLRSLLYVHSINLDRQPNMESDQSPNSSVVNGSLT